MRKKQNWLFQKLDNLGKSQNGTFWAVLIYFIAIVVFFSLLAIPGFAYAYWIGGIDFLGAAVFGFVMGLCGYVIIGWIIGVGLWVRDRIRKAPDKAAKD